eukprot:TRINITY_DN1342_c0_g1_i1.p1 TRINITY_DN1342_c0_g1~~TRINITY_DN1342_c0_g1_i1.p1  ORF type:complete len:462 (-),score=136.79 TRINITY_DN1342_c0_g1_i1:207-1592(-)
MLAKLFLVAVGLSVVFAQNIATFQRYDELTQDSGLSDALKGVDKVELADVNRTKGAGRLLITSITGKTDDVDVSGEKSEVDSDQLTIKYSGVKAVFGLKFNFDDSFGAAKSCSGSGEALYQIGQLYFTVQYAIEGGLPKYNLEFQITLTPPKMTLTGGCNDTVEHEVYDEITNATMAEFESALKGEVSKALKQTYDQRAATYKTLYEYKFGIYRGEFNTTLVDLRLSNDGATFIQNGSLVGIEGKTTALPNFNTERGPIQIAYTIGFLDTFVQFANGIDYFVWKLDDSNLQMPDFNFRMADVYIIFPDSRSDYHPGDKLHTVCNANEDYLPIVNLDQTNKQIQVVQQLQCVLLHPEDEIAKIVFVVQYNLNLDVEENGGSKVQVDDAILLGDITVTSQYEVNLRAKAIFATLLKQGLDAYISESTVLGNGFRAVPMAGAALTIGKDYIVVSGQHPETSTKL